MQYSRLSGNISISVDFWSWISFYVHMYSKTCLSIWHSYHHLASTCPCYPCVNFNHSPAGRFVFAVVYHRGRIFHDFRQ